MCRQLSGPAERLGFNLGDPAVDLRADRDRPTAVTGDRSTIWNRLQRREPETTGRAGRARSGPTVSPSWKPPGILAVERARPPHRSGARTGRGQRCRHAAGSGVGAGGRPRAASARSPECRSIRSSSGVRPCRGMMLKASIHASGCPAAPSQAAAGAGDVRRRCGRGQRCPPRRGRRARQGGGAAGAGARVSLRQAVRSPAGSASASRMVDRVGLRAGGQPGGIEPSAVRQPQAAGDLVQLLLRLAEQALVLDADRR